VEENLALYMTIEEAAAELGLTKRTVRRMISDTEHPDHILSRMATQEECLALFLAVPPRIKGIPGTGVRLIHQNAVAKAKKRKKRGRPATKIVHEP